MLVLIISLIATIFKTSLQLYYGDSTPHKLIFENFWTSLIANFGGKPKPSKIDQRLTYKLVIFITLLGGSLVFMFYKSYLSAVLTISLKKFPFNDMEGLSKTSWR